MLWTTYIKNNNLILNNQESNIVSNKKLIKINEKLHELVPKLYRRYKKKSLHDDVIVILSEWAHGGDLLDFFRNNYNKLSELEYTVIFFQLLFTLWIIHKYFPNFKHNDLKANNVLINTYQKKINCSYVYTFDNIKYNIPDVGISIYLWDFDFWCIQGIIENKKVNSEWANDLGINNTPNQYYDIHFFFNTLIKKNFCPGILNIEHHIITDFIHTIIPHKYQKNNSKSGRLLSNDEFITPTFLIKNHNLFKQFII